MYSNDPITYRKERRAKPDMICRWLEIAGFICWVSLFCVLLFYQNAQPQVETFLDRYFQLQLRETWDYQMLSTVFYLLLFLFVFSTVCLFLNFKRLRRSTDKLRKSFIISLIGSVAGMLMYLFFVVL